MVTRLTFGDADHPAVKTGQSPSRQSSTNAARSSIGTNIRAALESSGITLTGGVRRYLAQLNKPQRHEPRLITGTLAEMLADNVDRDWLSSVVRQSIADHNESLPPAPARPSTRGLGDMASSALAVVGITEDRVTAWIGEPCGCDERRRKLNQFGAWVRGVATGIVDGAKESLATIMGNH